ncbi:ester cyclase [Candidatus Peregrinibacteria bacterium]|nr:ester cyclase [Candidatus Peregrinibacteria bacterium]
MTNSEIAQDFLKMILEAKIDQAYSKYISSDFIHHNAYTPAGATALKEGMAQSESQFPNKIFQIHHLVSEGNLVMVHSLIKFNQDHPGIAVVHIFRIENGKIVELWDIGQQIPTDGINQNGMF